MCYFLMIERHIVVEDENACESEVVYQLVM